MTFQSRYADCMSALFAYWVEKVYNKQVCFRMVHIKERFDETDSAICPTGGGALHCRSACRRFCLCGASQRRISGLHRFPGVDPAAVSDAYRSRHPADRRIHCPVPGAVAPFTLLLLEGIPRQDADRITIRLLVLETAAANLGSMLTPMGNPQNLYLYNRYGFSMGTFLSAIAPYSVLSLALLAGSCLLFLPVQPIAPPRAQSRIQSPGRLGAYCLLFGVNLLTVLRILNPWILLGVICIALLLLDRSLFRKADYSLLLTFVFFFIFVGNMGNIPVLSGALQRFLQGRELLTAVLASQVISNVPAAILLSGLSEDGRALLIGTNLGGLGTLIASMASLITYKLYAAVPGSQPKRYMGVFTLCNLAYLAALLLLYVFI